MIEGEKNKEEWWWSNMRQNAPFNTLTTEGEILAIPTGD